MCFRGRTIRLGVVRVIKDDSWVLGLINLMLEEPSASKMVRGLLGEMPCKEELAKFPSDSSEERGRV